MTAISGYFLKISLDIRLNICRLIASSLNNYHQIDYWVLGFWSSMFQTTNNWCDLCPNEHWETCYSHYYYYYSNDDRQNAKHLKQLQQSQFKVVKILLTLEPLVPRDKEMELYPFKCVSIWIWFIPILFYVNAVFSQHTHKPCQAIPWLHCHMRGC